MKEVIESHEIFLKEFEVMRIPGSDINLDHDKTEEHIKEFRLRFDKLKVKILRLMKSSSAKL